MPGVVSVGAGLLLIFLLLYFIMVNYVNPIYKISEGLGAYKTNGRKYTYSFDGDDQLSDINAAVKDLVEENIELKQRVKSLKERQ